MWLKSILKYLLDILHKNYLKNKILYKLNYI